MQLCHHFLKLIYFGVLLTCLAIPPAKAQTNFRSQTMPYQAFDQLPKETITLGQAVLKVGFAPGNLELPKQTILTWLKHCAKIVKNYYGQFPTRSTRILIVPSQGKGLKGGQAFGYHGAAVRLFIGEKTNRQDLKRDWVAIHEMIHLALPSVKRKHLWLSEGLAVYIESIARVQAGDLKQETIWADFIRDMPKGLPQQGDKGLDHTPTWGRRYWGGALFCLLADIEIRKQTQNKYGLQTAVQGILKAGGNMEQFWSIQLILQTADQSTGTKALDQLYQTMQNRPVTPDLDHLWQQLGISQQNGQIKINNKAPLAPLRQAILKPSPY